MAKPSAPRPAALDALDASLAPLLTEEDNVASFVAAQLSTKSSAAVAEQLSAGVQTLGSELGAQVSERYEELLAEDADQKLLKLADKANQHILDQQSSRTFDAAIYKLRRARNETLRDFGNRSLDTFLRMEKYNEALTERQKGRILLRGSQLQPQQYNNLLTQSRGHYLASREWCGRSAWASSRQTSACMVCTHGGNKSQLGFAKKPTKFMTNSRSIGRELSRNCDGEHMHQPFVDGRATDAA